MSGSRPEVRSLRPAARFQQVVEDGVRLHGRYVVAFARASEEDLIRVGVSASSRVGTVVARNRLKRLLREAARLEKHLLGPRCDIVLIAKAAALGGGLDEIRADLGTVFARVRARLAGRGGADGKC